MADLFGDDTSQPVVIPLLASLLIHGAVVLAMVLLPKKPLPEVITTETELISGEDLMGIQAQIALAHAKYSANTSPKATTKATTASTMTNSSYNDDFAERERAYQAQVKAYAEALDQEILSEMELRQRQLDAQDQERQRQVQELQSRERSNDDIARQNSQELNKARERIEKLAQEAKNQNASTSTPQTPTVGRGGSTGTTSGTGGGSATTSGNSRSQATANIASRVQAIWERYDNPPNRRLSATISIDGSGNLVNVRFGAGDKDLEPSLQASIKEASPFPEMIDIATTFTINFSTK